MTEKNITKKELETMSKEKNKVAKLEKELKEEKDKAVELEKKLKEEGNKVAELEKKLKEEENKVTELEKELKEEKDIKTLNSVKKNWLQAYIDFGKKWKKSDYRLHKLDKIIRFLKKHGTVVIVRMPSSEEVIVIENQFWKNFDGNMLYLANKNQVHYFNYMKDNTQFQTYDGVHLDKIQGALFTKALCDSIQFKK